MFSLLVWLWKRFYRLEKGRFDQFISDHLFHNHQFEGGKKKFTKNVWWDLTNFIFGNVEINILFTESSLYGYGAVCRNLFILVRQKLSVKKLTVQLKPPSTLLFCTSAMYVLLQDQSVDNIPVCRLCGIQSLDLSYLDTFGEDGRYMVFAIQKYLDIEMIEKEIYSRNI